MGKNSGFILFDGYLERTSKLSDQELGRLMRALMNYHAHGTEPTLKGREEIAFDFIREDIDTMDRKYADKCEQNRRNRNGTTVDDRQRPSTTVDEEERNATNSDETVQIKRKRKIKKKSLLNDDDDDFSAGARRSVERKAAIYSAYADHAGRDPTPEEANALTTSANLLGFSPEMMTEAIRIAAANGARNIVGYTKKILDEWTREDVRTPDEAEAYKFDFDARTNRNEYGTTDPMRQMVEARQRRREKHAEETA